SPSTALRARSFDIPRKPHEVWFSARSEDRGKNNSVILSKHRFARGHSTASTDAGASVTGCRSRLHVRKNGGPTSTNPSGGRGQHLSKSLRCLPRTRWAREWPGVQGAETRSSRPDETFAAKWQRISCHSCASHHHVWHRQSPVRTRLEGDADLRADFP